MVNNAPITTIMVFVKVELFSVLATKRYDNGRHQLHKFPSLISSSDNSCLQVLRSHHQLMKVKLYENWHCDVVAKKLKF